MNSAWLKAHGTTLARLMGSDGDYGTLKLDEDEWNELRDALERARVVGVLDAWRLRGGMRTITYQQGPGGNVLEQVVLRDGQRILDVQEGPTPDAARAAAAKAIEAGEV